ncbi:MAG: hypothetical protein K8H88_11620 [Sandaracinaceae bacterium]|nr:hypothetical protein [Sandaracinaceae bacterium]
MQRIDGAEQVRVAQRRKDIARQLAHLILGEIVPESLRLLARQRAQLRGGQRSNLLAKVSTSSAVESTTTPPAS